VTHVSASSEKKNHNNEAPQQYPFTQSDWCSASSYCRCSSPRADAAEQSPSTVIVRSDSQPFQQAPAEHFTGSVHITPLFAAKPPSRAVEKVSDEQYGPAPSTTKNQRKPTQKRDE